MQEGELTKSNIIKWTLNIFFSDFNDRLINIYMYIFLVPSLITSSQGLFISSNLISSTLGTLLGFISSYPIISHKLIKKEISQILPIICQFIYFSIIIYMLIFSSLNVASVAGVSLILGPTISRLLILVLRYANELKIIKYYNFFRLFSLTAWISILLMLPTNEKERLILSIAMGLFDALSSLLLSLFYFCSNYKDLILKKNYYKELLNVFTKKEFIISILTYQITIIFGSLSSLVAASNLTSNFGKIQFFYAYKLSAYLQLPFNYLFIARGRKDLNIKLLSKFLSIILIVAVITITFILQISYKDIPFPILGNDLYLSAATIFVLLSAIYPRAITAFFLATYMRKAKYISIFKSYFLALLAFLLVLLAFFLFEYKLDTPMNFPPYILGIAEFTSFYLLINLGIFFS